MIKKYYWLQTSGKVREISESVFNYLLDNKKYALVTIAGVKITINQKANVVSVGRTQLEKILAGAVEE